MSEEFVHFEPFTFNFNLPEIDLQKIKHDLLVARHILCRRNLHHSVKWVTELNSSLADVKLEVKPTLKLEEETDKYLRANAYFQDGEYDRCADICKSCTSSVARFLYHYARYLSCEKKAIQNMMEPSAYFGNIYYKSMCSIANDIKRDYLDQKLDAYGLYTYGIVLKRSGQVNEALNIFLEAVNSEPMHWGAWVELSLLIKDKDQLGSIQVPNHWIKHFFIARAFMDLQMNDDAIAILGALREHGFEKSGYVKSQIAVAYYEKRDVDIAISLFRELEEEDPFRLDDFDTYSNLLYVKGMRKELANLAHKASEIDKYRVESCCIVANHYSLRCEHPKAVVYFQRALKINPHYLPAWTLMGHEFMELKNMNAAIHSYSQGVEINPKDYRAWYGLGQAYEVLKMYNYSRYYYKRAQALRPNDSRMLIALGVTFEKMDKHSEALICFYHARKVGDPDGITLTKLAKLFDKMEKSEQAAATYQQFLNEYENAVVENCYEISAAYKYLAYYYIKSDLDAAYRYAQRCLDFEDTRNDGEALLAVINDEQRGGSPSTGAQPDKQQADQSSLTTTDLDASL